jgi:hypothetical protein
MTVCVTVLELRLCCPQVDLVSGAADGSICLWDVKSLSSPSSASASTPEIVTPSAKLTGHVGRYVRDKIFLAHMVTNALYRSQTWTDTAPRRCVGQVEFAYSVVAVCFMMSHHCTAVCWHPLLCV